MNTVIQKEKQSWLKLSIILAFFFLYGWLTIATGDTDVKLDLSNAKFINMLKIGQVISVIIIFILPAILLTQFWTTEKIHYLGFTRFPKPSTALFAMLAMLLAMPFINWMSELNQQMHLPAALSGMEQWMKSSEEKAGVLTEAFMNTTSVKGLILNLFVIAFMAAVSEEIFFRGMLQKILIECFGNVHLAVWTGAILFSAFHMQFFGFFPRMIMGAFLGYLFLWSGSLWPGMLAHFMNNGAAVFIAWLNKRGVIADSAENIGTGSNQLMIVAVSAVLVGGLTYFIYRTEKQGMPLRVS